MGKLKGLEQVLWERGWIDEKIRGEYRKIKKNDDGEIIEEYSLEILIESCLDFANEISELQTVGEAIDCRILATPKFHAEIASEGVEYTWAFAKNWYRRQPLEEKRKKETFQKLVRKSLNNEFVTTAMVRKFSRRARAYICAYHAFENNHTMEDNEQVNSAISYKRIENLVKQFKCHRCVLHFDCRFVNSSVQFIKKLYFTVHIT